MGEDLKKLIKLKKPHQTEEKTYLLLVLGLDTFLISWLSN